MALHPENVVADRRRAFFLSLRIRRGATMRIRVAPLCGDGTLAEAQDATPYTEGVASDEETVRVSLPNAKPAIFPQEWRAILV